MGKSKNTNPLSRFDSRLLFWARAGVFLSLLTPLAYLPFVWHPFEAGKVWVFQTLIALTFPAWVLLAVRQPMFRLQPTRLHGAWVALVAAFGLSVVFAVDKHAALFGATDQMEGFLTWLHLLAFATMAMSVLRTERDLRIALQVVLGTSFLSALIALLQRFYPTLLGPEAGVQVSGTLGNPVFLSGFQAVTLLLTIYFWVKFSPLSKGLQAMCALHVVMSLVATVLAGSRGGIVALTLGLTAMALAYSVLRRQTKVLLILGIAVTLLVASYAAIARWAMPHPTLAEFWAKNINFRHLFETYDFVDRFSMWKLTLPGITERPLFGWGLGNYEGLFNRHYLTSEGCAYKALNDPHNLVLNLLATSGVVGFLAYMALLFLAAQKLLSFSQHKRLGDGASATLMGVLVATQVPLLFNPNTLSWKLMFFFVLAVIAQETSPEVSTAAQDTPPLKFWQLPWATAMGVLVALYLNVLPAAASYYSVEAGRAHHRQNTPQTMSFLKQAEKVSTPYVEEQLVVGLNHLSRVAEKGKLQQEEEWKTYVALVRNWATDYLQYSQRMFFKLAWLEFLNKVGTAVNASSFLEEAQVGYQALSQEKPTRHEVAFSYGEFLAQRGQLDEAEAIFRDMQAADASIGQSAFRYGAFVWKYRREAERGSSLIREGVHAQCPFVGRNVTEMAQVGQGLARQKDRAGMQYLLRYAHDERPGPNEKSYGLLASYYEDMGMLSDRDAILRTAIRRVKSSAKTFAPVLEGQKTMSQLLQPQRDTAEGASSRK